MGPKGLEDSLLHQSDLGINLNTLREDLSHPPYPMVAAQKAGVSIAWS